MRSPRPARPRDFSVAWIGAAAVVWVCAGTGCDLRQLEREELFGPTADASTQGPVDASSERPTSTGDAAGPADGPDGPPTSDASDGPLTPDASDGPPAPDASDGPLTPDATDGPPISTGDAGGTAMLSGVVSSACSASSGLAAKVGIAGRHRCSFAQKGSFFFPDLPVGTLELAVAKEGYLLYKATIVIQPGGTVHDVALVPASPGGCADPPPADVACSCTDADCLP